MLSRAIRVYLWCAFAFNPIVVLIRRINTRRNAARRLEEEIANVGAAPHGDQVPPLEEDANMENAMVNTPLLMDETIRTALLQMAQGITSQAKATMVQDQAMKAQSNHKIMPCLHQQVTIMASRLRHFT